MIPGTIILCAVIASPYSDADTIRCRTGEVIRLAGLSALERSGRCNSRPDCATIPYRQAKSIVDRITVGKTYRFRFIEMNGKRFVADNVGLRCQILRTGAAVTWWRYHRKYKLEGCR